MQHDMARENEKNSGYQGPSTKKEMILLALFLLEKKNRALEKTKVQV